MLPSTRSVNGTVPRALNAARLHVALVADTTVALTCCTPVATEPTTHTTWRGAPVPGATKPAPETATVVLGKFRAEAGLSWSSRVHAVLSPRHTPQRSTCAPELGTASQPAHEDPLPKQTLQASRPSVALSSVAPPTQTPHSLV